MIGEVIQVPHGPRTHQGYRNATVLFETPSYYILDEHDDGWKGLYRRSDLRKVMDWRRGQTTTDTRPELLSTAFLEELSRLHNTPPKPTFNPTLPVQTRDGRRACIYSTNGYGEYQLHGAIWEPTLAGWRSETWTREGHRVNNRFDDGDLINKEPR